MNALHSSSNPIVFEVLRPNPQFQAVDHRHIQKFEPIYDDNQSLAFKPASVDPNLKFKRYSDGQSSTLQPLIIVDQNPTFEPISGASSNEDWGSTCSDFSIEEISASSLLRSCSKTQQHHQRQHPQLQQKQHQQYQQQHQYQQPHHQQLQQQQQQQRRRRYYDVELATRDVTSAMERLRAKGHVIKDHVSVATQTDEDLDSADLYTSCASLHELCDIHAQDVPSPCGLYPWNKSDGVDCEPVSDYIDCLAADEDTSLFQDVALRKRNQSDKIGFTLFIGHAGMDDFHAELEEEDESECASSDVFVGDIDPCGLAGVDGRIQPGDQIVQINGVEVVSYEQALNAFRENRLDFNFLVRRRQISHLIDDGFMDDDATFLESAEMRRGLMNHGMTLECIDEEEDTDTEGMTETGSQKDRQEDSGVGKTDDSTRNEESSEQEMADNDCTSPGSTSNFTNKRVSTSRRLQSSNESFASSDLAPDNDQDIPSPQQCLRFYEMLKDRCNANVAAGSNVISAGSDESTGEEERLYDQLSRLQLRQYDKATAGSQDTVAKHDADGVLNAGQFRSSRQVPRMGTRRDYFRPVVVAPGDGFLVQQRHQPVAADHICILERSSSDCSKQINGDVNCDRNGSVSHVSRMQLASPESPVTRNPYSVLSHSVSESDDSGRYTRCLDASNESVHKDTIRSPNRVAVDSARRRSVSQMSQTDDEEKPQGKAHQTRIPQPAPPLRPPCALDSVMYTNRANLQHTISIQQRLFTRQLSDQSWQTGSPQQRDPENNFCEKQKVASPADERSCEMRLESNGNDVQMGKEAEELEWVVKRRADGTRYITRRPVRNRLLKERAKRVEHERRCQTTDDDDAASELKTGRYWNREERKRHAERAKSRRREREAQALQQEVVAMQRHMAPPNIVELSRRKMSRQRGRRTMDDFTTVQELLAHGSRDNHGKTNNPLLSVTTV